MNEKDVFHELTLDVMDIATISYQDASAVVEFLENEGLIDHDELFEYYREEEDD